MSSLPAEVAGAHLVSLSQKLEALVRFSISRVFVRMVPPGKQVVRLLDHFRLCIVWDL